MNAQETSVLGKVRHLHGLGVPKATIAKQLGVHRNTVAKWLSGEHQPLADLKKNAPASEQARGGLSTGENPVPQTGSSYPAEAVATAREEQRYE